MAKSDLAGVLAIESENPSPWSAESLAEELAIEHAVPIVAEMPDGHLVGWASCRVIRSEAELLKIAVEKLNRRRGIGHLLVKYLFCEMRKRKAVSLFLEVRSDNRIALNFYEKHGFLHIGSRLKYYQDPLDDALVLEKKF